MTFSVKLLLSFSVLIILLHLWGALDPSHYNWGVHFFAFYNLPVSLGAFLIALAVLITPVREALAKTIDGFLNLLSSTPAIVKVALGLFTVLSLTVLFPSRGLLLGDSKLILLTTTHLPASGELSANYRNQPLVVLALRSIESVLNVFGTPELQDVYVTLDVIATVLFFVIAILFTRTLHISPLGKFLAGLFLLAGGGSQFFFGYIENYSLLYVSIAAYILTGWMSLQKQIHPLIPLICFALCAGLHLGALVVLPSVFVLLYFFWREHKPIAIIISIGIVLTSVAVFSASQYSLQRFVERMNAAIQYDFLPLFTPPQGFPYAMVSWLHILDWLNANLLIVPFGLVPSILLLIANRKAINITSPGVMFFLSAALCGLLFTFVIHPALGMFRDWDLLASFFVPLMFFTVYIFFQTLQSSNNKNFILAIVILSILHTASWVGVNANNERHLQRSEVVTNPSFLGTFAQILYYDRLANIYWERKDYTRVKLWYERYFALDSTNPRIVGNLSDAYRRLGEKENSFQMLILAASLNSRDPGVYSNLGVEYFVRGDTTNAITMSEQSLLLNAHQPHVHANLGTYYAMKKNFIAAIDHFKKAIEQGMKDPFLHKMIGDAYMLMAHDSDALAYYKTYLRMNPRDEQIQLIAAQLNAQLGSVAKRFEEGRRKELK